MRTIYKKLPSERKRCTATIGVFDGIHRGHQHILRTVKKEAEKNKLASLVITFDIPPQKVLGKHFLGCITSFDEKKRLIALLGIDYLWVLKTSRPLLGLSGEKFIQHVLKYFDIKKLIVGEDFRFGYKERSDICALGAFARKYRFILKTVRKKQKARIVISSSCIREVIEKGNFNKAQALLGRDYSLRGEVVKGKGVGKRIGFPTANIYASDYAIPQEGVYAGYTKINKNKYLVAVNIGRQPTVSSAQRVTLEAHIINFRKNILGKSIEVVFLERVRGEKKFSSLKKLQQAIHKDICTVRRRYSRLLLKQ